MIGAIFARAADAGAMFWESLDTREKLLVLYAGAIIAVLLMHQMGRDEERRREDRLIARIEERIHG